MKYHLLGPIFFLACAHAQSPSPTTAAETPEQSCLAACPLTDVNCKAACAGVPHPGNAQMNATTNCVAQCPQGNGSPAAIQQYTSCQQACISSYIVLSGTAAPGGADSTAGQTVSAPATGTGVPTLVSNGTGSSTANSTSSKGLAALPSVIGVGGTVGMILAAVAML